jgi:hypothetical protein
MKMYWYARFMVAFSIVFIALFTYGLFYFGGRGTWDLIIFVSTSAGIYAMFRIDEYFTRKEEETHGKSGQVPERT